MPAVEPLPPIYQLLRDAHERVKNMTAEQKAERSRQAASDEDERRKRRRAGLPEEPAPPAAEPDPPPAPEREPASDREWVVRAARTLESPFSSEELVVAAWRLCPARFGLKGFPQFPDHHRVRWMLSARGGPVHLGLLRRTGRGLYAVNEETSGA